MKVHICAVGRIRSGPERTLIDDYARRFAKAGRPLSLGPLAEHEAVPRNATGPEAETQALRRLIPESAAICVLDERGERLDSPSFADCLIRWRDDGSRDACFLIGGADGLAPDLRAGAGVSLSFGPMVWPHKLARVMLAEQLYRAVSILSGSPYHRA